MTRQQLDENRPQARCEEPMEVKIGADGRAAWCMAEPDAPGLLALISDRDMGGVPRDPVNATMTFEIVDEISSQSMGRIDIAGRVGLNEWYLAHVGYEPDKEPGEKISIGVLIGDVASHLLLRVADGSGMPELGGVR